MLAICYKAKTPIVYNEGTKYERRCDEFLAYYTGKNRVDAEKEAERLTKEKPNKWFNGCVAPEVEYYFVVDQDMFQKTNKLKEGSQKSYGNNFLLPGRRRKYFGRIPILEKIFENFPEKLQKKG